MARQPPPSIFDFVPILLLLLPLASAWDCPAAGSPPVSVGIDIPDGYSSLAADFDLQVFNTLQAGSVSDCQLQAYYQACVNNNTAFFVYSDTALTTDPATFSPSNCLVGFTCANGTAPGNTTVQMGAVPQCSKTCDGSAQTKKQLKCPAKSVKVKRVWCNPYPWVCACQGNRIAVRNPNTGKLLKCKVPPKATV